MNSDHAICFFPEKQIAGFTRHDGTIAFYTFVNALLRPDMIVLDVGCGRGAFLEDPVEYRKNLRLLRGKVLKVIGLDVDPAAARNASIDEFCLLNHPDEKWPMQDRSIDLIVSDWTLEHVYNPDLFFDEIRRVLKPGGYLCIRTTNSWGYVTWGARLIPKKYHTKVIQFMQSGQRREEDIFPTVYRCNSIPKIKRMLKQYQMDGVIYAHEGVPGYLNFSRLAFFFGILFEHFAPQYLRHTLFVFARKRE